MAVSIVIVLAMTLTMLLASSAKSFATSDTSFRFRVLPRQENVKNLMKPLSSKTQIKDLLLHL